MNTLNTMFMNLKFAEDYFDWNVYGSGLMELFDGTQYIT